MADEVQPRPRTVKMPEPTGPVPDVWLPDGTFDSARAAVIFEEAQSWQPEQRAAMLTSLRAAEVRAVVKTKYSHPAAMAAAVVADYVLTPALTMISESIERVLNSRRKINLLVTMPPQEGKLASMSTPIPTPDGWTTHGDIVKGDTVYHPSGVPIKVLEVHPAGVADRRVHFSDGSHMDVHHRHEWTVFDRSRNSNTRASVCEQCGNEFIGWAQNTSRYCGHSCASRARWGHDPAVESASRQVSSPGLWRTVETAYLETQRLSSGDPGRRGHRYRFQLPHQDALIGEPANLPVDPYTLGVWLGDGTSSKPALTHHPDDEYEIPYPRTARCVHADTGVLTDYYSGALWRGLKAAGVVNNKHIPTEYLRASIAQRRSLLAGLIDSDGCVSGTVTCFDNANDRLIQDVAALARSLGYRAGVHAPQRPVLSTSGIQGRQWMCRVQFSPHDEPPARLGRKQANFKPALRRRLAITRIEKINPVPGRCITVDSEDGLYLAGPNLTPTHNSDLCSVWTPLRALQLNPNRRIILATYGDALAEAHSRRAREIIQTHGTDVRDKLTGLASTDKIGLRLARGANKVSAWSVEGGAGGLVAAGIGSTITGLPADLFVIDDPFKNMMEADSAAHRDRVHTWFSTVALTRLAPDASVILIQTRWHPEDLAGKVLAGEKLLPKAERTWKHLNIPAIAEEGIRDDLHRPLGTPMQSARDTPEAQRDFATTRRQVGERTWYALYQGSPRNPAGGIFLRAWFDPRLPEPPMYPVATIVGVDPADSGEGDEAGIIAGMLMQDGRVALTHDRSGQYTSDQWAREAVLLALELGAREIAVEAYTTATTYVQVVKRAYSAIHKEAVAKSHSGSALTPVEVRALPDLPPFMVTKWRGANKADAVARSGGLSQSLETGRCRTLEFALAVFEEQAADWQAGQHQPDRVAAAVIVHDKLMELAGAQMSVAAPINRNPGEPPEWMRRRIG